MVVATLYFIPKSKFLLKILYTIEHDLVFLEILQVQDLAEFNSIVWDPHQAEHFW